MIQLASHMHPVGEKLILLLDAGKGTNNLVWKFWFFWFHTPVLYLYFWLLYFFAWDKGRLCPKEKDRVIKHLPWKELFKRTST